MRSLYAFIVQVLPGFDGVVIAICWALACNRGAVLTPFELIMTCLAVPVCVSAYRYFGVYESHRIGGLVNLVRGLLSAHIAIATLAGAINAVVGQWTPVPNIGLFTLLTAVGVLAPRLLFYMVASLVRRRGFDVRKVCVIGSWEDARTVAARFAAQPEWGLAVTYVGIGEPAKRTFYAYQSGREIASGLKELLHHEVVDEVVAVTAPRDVASEFDSLRTASVHGIVCRIMMKPQIDDLGRARLEPYCGDFTLAVADCERNWWQVAVKRTIDAVGSAVALLALSPLLLLIAGMVKLSSPGPIIFRQTRIGLNGRKFTIFKFRTMVRDAEDLLPTVATQKTMNGPVFKDPQDCRVTPLGRILRRFSLDELPQFVNVLLGDMSLVGPRPLPVYEAREIEGAYRKRFSVKPGLTGLWQISGRSQMNFSSWMNYDLQYVNGWSLWLDVKVLLKTVPAVFAGRGAY